MFMQLDSAVAELLRLDTNRTHVEAAGGGGCSSASTFKITSQSPDGNDKRFFLKIGSGDAAETMFRGEHASLQAIHAIVPSLCPQSFGHGRFESDPKTSFLVTDFLHIGFRSGSRSNTAQTLAVKLAQLHTTPAPVPQGYESPMFGFPVTTCCGDTPQDNGFKKSWAAFYAENRLRSILRQAEKRNGRDSELHRSVEDVASKVVPRLLADDHLNNGKGVTPVVVHGDLWSGNASVGAMDSGKGDQEDIIFDSSACYAHNEYELGIMKMFGGFGTTFLEEYHQHCPKTEPVDEYEDRVKLYELYHHLNHYAMFGGGYKRGAMSIIGDLIKKYGK